MKILNLTQAGKIKRENVIYEYCGGHYSRKEAIALGGIGVAGIRYVDGVEVIDQDKTYPELKSNTETLKEGIGIYLRDERDNYLILIRNEEILNIFFEKKVDNIKMREGFSFFRKCLERGMAYHYAKIMLMEDEMIEIHTPMLKIVTKELDEINFKCTKRNPLKVAAYFRNSPYADRFEEDYQTYQLVE